MCIRDSATSDHVHASDFSLFDDDYAPVYAASQMQTNAVGGPPRTRRSLANYSFIDGHVATHAFGDLYRTAHDNRFSPDFAH